MNVDGCAGQDSRWSGRNSVGQGDPTFSRREKNPGRLDTLVAHTPNAAQHFTIGFWLPPTLELTYTALLRNFSRDTRAACHRMLEGMSPRRAAETACRRGVETHRAMTLHNNDLTTFRSLIAL